MESGIYNLPTYSIIGGSQEQFDFPVYSSGGSPYDLTNCTLNFAVSSVVDQATPIISKTPTKILGPDEETVNVARAILLGSDTKNLFGRYVYMLTIKDSNGTSEIPGKGFLDIGQNINPSFI